MTKPITIEVPENAVAMVGVDAGTFGHELLVAAVLRWFEEGRLSQGQSAEMLGMKRGEFFDLLSKYKVSPINITVEELEEEFRRG